MICKQTSSVLFVDFVFEERNRRTGRSFLASVYFSASRGGGPLAKYAAKYMRTVQRVCNRDMNFFPTVLAMCVYSSERKVYARDVGLHGGI